jgi:hypothetical protein
LDPAWLNGLKCQILNTETLGKTSVSGAPFVNPEGAAFAIDRDLLGVPHQPGVPGPLNVEGSFDVAIWAPKKAPK